MTAEELIDNYRDYLYDSNKQATLAGDVEKLVQDTVMRCHRWLRDHIQIPQTIETDENGVPLAESFFENAARRCEVADKIGAKFLEDMKTKY